MVVNAAQAIVVEASENKRLSFNICGNDFRSVKGEQHVAYEVSGCLLTQKTGVEAELEIALILSLVFQASAYLMWTLGGRQRIAVFSKAPKLTRHCFTVKTAQDCGYVEIFLWDYFHVTFFFNIHSKYSHKKALPQSLKSKFVKSILFTMNVKVFPNNDTWCKYFFEKSVFSCNFWNKLCMIRGFIMTFWHMNMKYLLIYNPHYSPVPVWLLLISFLVPIISPSAFKYTLLFSPLPSPVLCDQWVKLGLFIWTYVKESFIGIWVLYLGYITKGKYFSLSNY